MREKTIGGGLAAIDVRLTTQLSMVIGRIKKTHPFWTTVLDVR